MKRYRDKYEQFGWSFVSTTAFLSNANNLLGIEGDIQNSFSPPFSSDKAIALAWAIGDEEQETSALEGSYVELYATNLSITEVAPVTVPPAYPLPALVSSSLRGCQENVPTVSRVSSKSYGKVVICRIHEALQELQHRRIRI